MIRCVSEPEEREPRLSDAERNRRWSPRSAADLAEALAIVRGYAGGRSVRALATESGRSYGYVHRRVASLGELRSYSDARQLREARRNGDD